MKISISFILLFSFVILLGFWWYCEQSPIADDGRVVIRWVVNSQESEQRFAKQIQSAFESAHPTIHVELIKQNEGSKVDTMIAGGDAPDVIAVEYTRTTYYVDADALVDLRTLMSPTQVTALNDYFPVTRGPFEHRNKIYAIPWGYVPFILYYNRALFDKAKLAYPTDSWTWEDYRKSAKAMTSPEGVESSSVTFGSTFSAWQEGYYSWFAQNGATIINPGDRSVHFDSPAVVAAVDFLHTLTQIDKSMPTDTNRPKSTGGLFESGRVGMNGPAGSFYIPTYRSLSNLDWDIASVPSGPNKRATVVSPIGFGVTSRSRHPKEAWTFVQFLTGLEGERLLGESDLFVPCMREIALSKQFQSKSGLPRNRYTLTAMLDDRNGKKPWGFVPEVEGVRWADINDDALNAKLNSYLFGSPKIGETSRAICQQINTLANSILSAERSVSSSHRMPFHKIVLTSIISICIAIYFLLTLLGKIKISRSALQEAIHGYTAIMPWLIGLLFFSLGPMLFSFCMSFTHWNSLAPISHACWVGLQNYETMFAGKDEMFTKSLRITFTYAIIAVPLNLMGGLALAILLNAKMRGISLYRTIYYLPAILPGVATAVLFRWLLGKQGLMNYVLSFGGAIHVVNMPDWLHDARWTLPSMTSLSLWAMGSGTMIYLAGLQNVPSQLYEAADLDGANNWRKFRNITLPMLSPVLLFNLVTGTIGAFQVFANAFVLYGGNTGPDNSALFYAYYLYRKAFEQFQAGYASALSWILFVIVLFLTLLILRSSSVWVYYEGKRDSVQ